MRDALNLPEVFVDALGDVFVYTGGDHQVHDGVRLARIHEDVNIVRARAFCSRQRLFHLIYVEFHDGIEIIEEEAFDCCFSLCSSVNMLGIRGPIKLLGVKVIKAGAFNNCYVLTDVEFGDKLETIEQNAFSSAGLKNVKMLSVRTVGRAAFSKCPWLTDVEFGSPLQTLQKDTFIGCDKLERIALPLRGGMIEDGVFDQCPKLTTVDLVGGIHQTVASLHMESWRNEMTEEINRINKVLPTITAGKTEAIQQWMDSVINLLDHYKAEHNNLLKEATTLLELALWKANIGDNGGERLSREGVRTTRGGQKRARKGICVKSGADVVIKNVLPFLKLLEY